MLSTPDSALCFHAVHLPRLFVRLLGQILLQRCLVHALSQFW